MKPFFFNRCFEKNNLKALIAWSLLNFGERKTLNLVEKLKNMGFMYATQAGISLGLDDLKTPPTKISLISEAESQTQVTQKEYYQGNLTAVEKFQQLIDTWHRTSELLKQEVIKNFKSTDILNPVYMMAFSGARGNISQVRQLVGMRGLMADPQGQIIDFPIRSNFREGLTLTEYVISCYGARKGLVDTALRTANSGYLTRRLVDVSQHVIIGWMNCGTTRGISLRNMIVQKKIILPLENRLVGRVLAENLPPIALKNQQISIELASKIAKLKESILVRSPLTCKHKKFLCQFCYGWSLAYGNLVAMGEAVGVLAAQSIGEPGTQLTMRTFHTGGVFSGGVVDEIRAPFNGFVHFHNSLPGKLIRTSYGKIAFFTKKQGEITLYSSELYFDKQVLLTSEPRQSLDNRNLNSRSLLPETLVSSKTKNLAFTGVKDLQKQKDQRFVSERSLEFSLTQISNVNSESKKIRIFLPECTILFIRNAGKMYKGQLVAEFSSIANQKHEQIQAEHRVYSEIAGQVFLKRNEEVAGQMKEQINSLWILSGKIYKASLASPLFLKNGDAVDTTTIINQSLGLTTNRGLISSYLLDKKIRYDSEQSFRQKDIFNNTEEKPYSIKGTTHFFASDLFETKGKQDQQIVLKQPLQFFFINTPYFKKFGYFFSFSLPKSKRIDANSSSDRNRIDFLFSTSSLKENIKHFSKNDQLEWSKKANLYQWFPKIFQTKTGGILVSEELNENLFDRVLFWLPEESYFLSALNSCSPKPGLGNRNLTSRSLLPEALVSSKTKNLAFTEVKDLQKQRDKGFVSTDKRRKQVLLNQKSVSTKQKFSFSRGWHSGDSPLFFRLNRQGKKSPVYLKYSGFFPSLKTHNIKFEVSQHTQKLKNQNASKKTDSYLSEQSFRQKEKSVFLSFKLSPFSRYTSSSLPQTRFRQMSKFKKSNFLNLRKLFPFFFNLYPKAIKKQNSNIATLKSKDLFRQKQVNLNLNSRELLKVKNSRLLLTETLVSSKTKNLAFTGVKDLQKQKDKSPQYNSVKTKRLAIQSGWVYFPKIDEKFLKGVQISNKTHNIRFDTTRVDYLAFDQQIILTEYLRIFWPSHKDKSLKLNYRKGISEPEHLNSRSPKQGLGSRNKVSADKKAFRQKLRSPKQNLGSRKSVSTDDALVFNKTKNVAFTGIKDLQSQRDQKSFLQQRLFGFNQNRKIFPLISFVSKVSAKSAYRLNLNSDSFLPQALVSSKTKNLTFTGVKDLQKQKDKSSIKNHKKILDLKDQLGLLSFFSKKPFSNFLNNQKKRLKYRRSLLIRGGTQNRKWNKVLLSCRENQDYTLNIKRKNPWIKKNFQLILNKKDYGLNNRIELNQFNCSLIWPLLLINWDRKALEKYYLTRIKKTIITRFTPGIMKNVLNKRLKTEKAAKNIFSDSEQSFRQKSETNIFRLFNIFLFGEKNILEFRNCLVEKQKAEVRKTKKEKLVKTIFPEKPKILILFRKIKPYSVLDPHQYKKVIYSINQKEIAFELIVSSNFVQQKKTKLFSFESSNDLQIKIVKPLGLKKNNSTFFNKIALQRIIISASPIIDRGLSAVTSQIKVTPLNRKPDMNNRSDKRKKFKNNLDKVGFYNSKSGSFEKTFFLAVYSFSAFCLANISSVTTCVEQARHQPFSSLKKETWRSTNSPTFLTNFLSPYNGEIARSDSNSSCIVVTNSDQITISTSDFFPNPKSFNSKSFLNLNSRLDKKKLTKFRTNSISIVVGKLLRSGEQITLNTGTKFLRSAGIRQSGQVIQIEVKKIVLRLAYPVLLSAGSVFHVQHTSFVEKNTQLFTLFYQIVKTGDIVQGIPKIEQLFEARGPLIEGRGTEERQLFSSGLSARFWRIYLNYSKKFSNQIAVRKSFEEIQQIIVQEVYIVYQEQGVHLAEKHLEIIVRQMTSFVLIINPGDTCFLPGEILPLALVEKANDYLLFLDITPSLYKDYEYAQYVPVLFGITKAALRAEGFISAASFQETTRVLSQAAIEKRKDYLRGLKENVVLGRVIPAGTGFPMWRWKSSLLSQGTVQNKETNILKTKLQLVKSRFVAESLDSLLL